MKTVVLNMIGWIIAAAGLVMAWLEQNKEKIHAIIVRIEKDTQDGGWSHKDKENLAVDLFFQELYPMLPWYIKMLPKKFIENKIRGVIKTLCEKSHKLKTAAKNIENNTGK